MKVKAVHKRSLPATSEALDARMFFWTLKLSYQLPDFQLLLVPVVAIPTASPALLQVLAATGWGNWWTSKANQHCGKGHFKPKDVHCPCSASSEPGGVEGETRRLCKRKQATRSVLLCSLKCSGSWSVLGSQFYFTTALQDWEYTFCFLSCRVSYLKETLNAPTHPTKVLSCQYLPC